MTGVGARDFLLRMLYADNSGSAPNSFHQDSAYAINAAMQEIHKSPLGSAWSRQLWAFPTVPGVGEYTLEPRISNVLGDVRCDNVHVSECQHEGSFPELASRFGVPATGAPRFYHVQRIHGGSLRADATVLQMQLWPVPRRPHSISFDAVIEPRNFSACDLDNPETVIPVPEQQVESILLPIAAEYLLMSTKNVADRVRQAVPTAAARARALLGYSEPSAAKREGVAA